MVFRRAFSAVMMTALVLIGCMACESETVAPPASDEQALQVAYFRALFEIEPWTGAAAYCVSTGTWVERKDPDATVIVELQGDGPLVVGSSACAVGTLGATYNGQPARSYHIDRIEQAGNEATIEGFYRQAAIDGGGYRCTALKNAASWTIRECTQTWVS
jgi:hypothetical protein